MRQVGDGLDSLVDDHSIRYRRLQEGDIGQVWDLLQRVSNFQLSADAQRTIFAKYESQTATAAFVGELKGEIVGFGEVAVAQLFRGQPVAAIHNVVVKHDGRGWGSAIVQRLVAHAREQGCFKCVLEASDEIAGFYEALGFGKQGSSFVKRLREG